MEMIETQNPEVIGHLDKIKMHNKERYFSQKDDWYQALIEETLKLIKKKNAILEINTRGIYKGRCKELFPSKSILLQAQKMGIPMMLSSDAHHPDELNGAFPQALSILKNIGIGELFEFHLGNWKAVLI
jgi:histidinol-phosphatase (PHP family)